MEHYRVLPTDTRFQELTQEQINILYTYFLLNPDDSILKELHSKNTMLEKQKTEMPVDLLKKQGYSEKEIQDIQHALEKQVLG